MQAYVEAKRVWTPGAFNQSASEATPKEADVAALGTKVAQWATKATEAKPAMKGKDSFFTAKPGK